MDRVVQLDQKALRVAFDIKHSEPQDLEKKFDEISEFYQPFVRYCREDAPGSFDQELILKIKANIPKIHKLLSNYI